MGPDSAWDIGPGGKSSAVASSVGQSLGRQLQIGSSVNDSGQTWVAGTKLNLVRGGAGWQSAEPPQPSIRATAFAVLNERVVAYPFDAGSPLEMPSVSAGEPQPKDESK